MEKTRSPIKRTFVGVVVSDKMDKTIVVKREIRKRHPVYKKFVKKYLKLKAHDAKNEACIGDVVKVIESRPISKEKKWRLAEIIEKGQRG